MKSRRTSESAMFSGCISTKSKMNYTTESGNHSKRFQSLIDGLQLQILALNATLQMVKSVQKSSAPLVEPEFDSISNSGNDENSDYFVAASVLERLCLIFFCTITFILSVAFFVHGFNVQEPVP